MAIIFKDPVNQSKGKEKDALKCLKNASKVGGGDASKKESHLRALAYLESLQMNFCKVR